MKMHKIFTLALVICMVMIMFVLKVLFYCILLKSMKCFGKMIRMMIFVHYLFDLILLLLI